MGYADQISGIIVKVKSIEDFINFYNSTATTKSDIFYMYTTDDNTYPIGTVRDNTKFCFPEGSNVKIIYDNPNDTLKVEFIAAPTQRPSF